MENHEIGVYVHVYVCSLAYLYARVSLDSGTGALCGSVCGQCIVHTRTMSSQGSGLKWRGGAKGCQSNGSEDEDANDDGKI